MHLSTIITTDGRNGMPNKKSPCFVLEKSKLAKNLTVFAMLEEKTQATFLYTLKCFHEKEGLERIKSTLLGFSIGNFTELSHIKAFEDKHIHSYAPAYYPNEAITLAKASQTMSFNSLSQWQKYAPLCHTHTSLGLRINPKLKLEQPSHCDTSHSHSRFGVSYSKFLLLFQTQKELFKDLEGLHFHIFCYQDFLALEMLLTHIEENYQEILPSLKWINFGGGQNFTDANYDLQAFIKAINRFSQNHPQLQLYFEPASSVVANTGYFRTTILDIIVGTPSIVILDTSIETHLLDIAITQQQIKPSEASHKKTPYHYQLTGMSCIEGDLLGTYYFDSPLKIGDTLTFDDMIGYTLVKQTGFNGIKEVGFRVE